MVPDERSGSRSRPKLKHVLVWRRDHHLDPPRDARRRCLRARPAAEGQGRRPLRRRPRPRPVAGRGGRQDGRRPGARQPHRAAPREDGRGGARARPPGARRTDRHHRRGLAGRRWSSRRSRSSAGSTACINNAFGIPPMDPITTDRARGRCARPTRPTCSRRCGSRRCSPTRWRRRKGSIIMLNSCVVVQLAAGVRRLQAVQGRARAPRLVAGHRARPARHPGQQRRAVVHLRGRQQGLLRLARRPRPGVTHEEIYAEKAGPTDLKRLASPEEVARAALFLASDLASAVTGQMLTVDCGEFHD